MFLFCFKEKRYRHKRWCNRERGHSSTVSYTPFPPKLVCISSFFNTERRANNQQLRLLLHFLRQRDRVHYTKYTDSVVLWITQSYISTEHRIYTEVQFVPVCSGTKNAPRVSTQWAARRAVKTHGGYFFSFYYLFTDMLPVDEHQAADAHVVPFSLSLSPCVPINADWSRSR